MASQTPNIGLQLYDEGDPANLADQYNNSMNTLDGMIPGISDNAGQAIARLNALGITDTTAAETSKTEWDGAVDLSKTNEEEIDGINANLDALHANTVPDATALYETIMSSTKWNNLVALGVDNTGQTEVSSKINEIIRTSNIPGVIFMPGRYRISSPIVLPKHNESPYSVFIAPGATIISDGISGDMFTLGGYDKTGECDGFRFFGSGTIDGNWQATNGIHALSSIKRSIIEGITINNCVTNGILFENTQPVDSQFIGLKINGQTYSADTAHRTENGVNIYGTDWLMDNFYATSCKNFIICNGGAQINNVHIFNGVNLAVGSVGILINKGFQQLVNIYIDTIQTGIDSSKASGPIHITNLQHFFYAPINAPVVGVNASGGQQVMIHGYDWTYKEQNTQKTTPIQYDDGNTRGSDLNSFAAVKDTVNAYNFIGSVFETQGTPMPLCITEEVNLSSPGDGILIGYVNPEKNPSGVATIMGTITENAGFSFPQTIRFVFDGSTLLGGVIGALNQENQLQFTKYITLNGYTPLYIGIGADAVENGYRPVYLYNPTYASNLVTKTYFTPAAGNRNGMIVNHSSKKISGLTDEMMLVTSKS